MSNKTNGEKKMTIKKLTKEPGGPVRTPLKLKVVSVAKTIDYTNQKGIDMKMKFITFADKSDRITGKLYDMGKTEVIQEGQCVCLQDYIYDAKDQRVVITSKTLVMKARRFSAIGESPKAQQAKNLKREERPQNQETLASPPQVKEGHRQVNSMPMALGTTQVPALDGTPVHGRTHSCAYTPSKNVSPLPQEPKQEEKVTSDPKEQEALSELLNILQHGSKKQLRSLNLIGDKKTKMIIEWRSHNALKQIEDLEKIDGISTKIVEALKKQFLEMHASEALSISNAC
ncbi:kinesin-like protein KIF22 [Polypterus senegalus]|uniref:kinesin-like protein KIF22 n=1 Tax=Polypterus senegalus TaxID=55291 RepID=UPI00196265AF|nr:kinesin-like protein KIF22 [Polypterus senegalus]XP_039620891.1 kinesin-like protein KIF22 [Polypterus senegalus]